MQLCERDACIRSMEWHLPSANVMKSLEEVVGMAARILRLRILRNVSDEIFVTLS